MWSLNDGTLTWRGTRGEGEVIDYHLYATRHPPPATRHPPALPLCLIVAIILPYVWS